MRHTSARVLFIAAALTLTACAEKPSEAPTPPTFTLLESSGWADTEIPAVASMPVDSDLVVVKLDGQRLPIRVTADTVAIRLPRGVAQGTLTLSYGSVPALEEPITIADFQDSYDGPSVRGYVLPVTGGSTPVVLATGESSLVRIDLRPVPAVTVYPAAMHATACYAAPGPTYLAGVFALNGWRPDTTNPGTGSCVWRTWRLGQPTALDSANAPWGGYSTAQIGPGQWTYANNTFWTIGTTSGWGAYAREVRSVRISPRGTVATFTHAGTFCCTGGAAPVLDAVTGQPRYSLPPTLREIWAATFSPHGDTLYVVGRDTSSAAASVRVIAVDAESGTLLDSATVPDSLMVDARFNGLDDVLADPDRPFLYVFAEPNLTVLDLHTLQPVVQLRGVEPAIAHTGWARLVLSRSEGMIYAVEAPNPWDFAAPAPIYRFRLPT